MIVDDADQEIWNLRSTEAFSLRATCLQVEVAHTFVGVHNEHFLPHRRRGRSNRGCRVLGSAPLNKEFDTTKSVLFNVLDTWLEPARFYADVQYVMALRMMRLALGGSPAATETWNMVSEKVSAFEEAQVAIVTT